MSSVLVRLDAQDRIGIEPQHLVDTRGEQHQQMAHPRGEVDSIPVHRVGLHDLRGVAEPFLQSTTTPGTGRRRRPIPDSAASAIENGSHAIGFFGSLTRFPAPVAATGA